MRFWGPAVQIETIEERDALIFRAIGEWRGIDVLHMGATLLSLGIAAWNRSGTMAFFVVWFAMALAFFTKPTGRLRSQLRVTQEELVASSNLSSWRVSSFSLRWRRVSGLRYQNGPMNEDETGSSGLYAQGADNCILPGITPDQAYDVATAIYLRFPLTDMADSSGIGSPIYGDSSQIVSLGLARRDS